MFGTTALRQRDLQAVNERVGREHEWAPDEMALGFPTLVKRSPPAAVVAVSRSDRHRPHQRLPALRNPHAVAAASPVTHDAAAPSPTKSTLSKAEQERLHRRQRHGRQRRDIETVRAALQRSAVPELIRKPFRATLSGKVSTVDRYAVYLTPEAAAVTALLDPPSVCERKERERRLGAVVRDKQEQLAHHMDEWGSTRALRAALAALAREEADGRAAVRARERAALEPLAEQCERLLTRHVVRCGRQVRAQARRERERQRRKRLAALAAALAEEETVRRRGLGVECAFSVASLQRESVCSDQAVTRLYIDLAWKRELFTLKRRAGMEHDELARYLARRAAWLREREDERDAVCKEEEALRRMHADDELTKAGGIAKLRAADRGEVLALLARREAKRREEHEKHLRRVAALCAKQEAAEAERRGRVAGGEREARGALNALRVEGHRDAAARCLAREAEERRLLAALQADERAAAEAVEEEARGVAEERAARRWGRMLEWGQRMVALCRLPLRAACAALDAVSDWHEDLEDPDEEGVGEGTSREKRTWWHRPISRHLSGFRPPPGLNGPVPPLPTFVMGSGPATLMEGLQFEKREGVESVEYTRCTVAVEIVEGYTGRERVMLATTKVAAAFYDTPTPLKYVAGAGVVHLVEDKPVTLCTRVPEWCAKTRTLEVEANLASSGKWFGGDPTRPLAILNDLVSSVQLYCRCVEDGDSGAEQAEEGAKEQSGAVPGSHNVRAIMRVTLFSRETEASYELPITVALTQPLLVDTRSRHTVVYPLHGTEERAVEGEEGTEVDTPQPPRTPPADAKEKTKAPPKVEEVKMQPLFASCFVEGTQHRDVVVPDLQGCVLTIGVVEGCAAADALVFDKRYKTTKKGLVKGEGGETVLSIDPASCPGLVPTLTHEHAGYKVEAAAVSALVSLLEALCFQSDSQEIQNRRVAVRLATPKGSVLFDTAVTVKVHGGARVYMSLGRGAEVQPAHRLPGQCNPKHVEYMDARGTKVFGSFVIQTSDEDESLLEGGRVTVSLIGSSKRDTIALDADDEILIDDKRAVTLRSEVHGFTREIAVGQVLVASNPRKGNNVGSLRVMLRPGVPASAVQRLVRNVSFGCEKGRKAGTVSASVVLDAEDASSERFATQQVLRVCNPLFDVPTQFVQQEYKEGSGPKRLAVFECDSALDPASDIVYEGQITVEVIDGCEEDHLILLPYKGCDFALTTQGNKSLIASTVTDRQIGWLYSTYNTLPSSAIRIELATKKGTAMSIKKEVLGVMRGLHYENSSKDPQLTKIIVVSLRGDCGETRIVIEYQVIPVNDPTQVILPYTELTYAPNTDECQNGVMLMRDATLHDPDTTHVAQGGFLQVDLVGGSGMGTGDTFIIVPPDLQAVLYPDTPHRVVFDADAGRLEVDDKWGAAVHVREEKAFTVKFLQMLNGCEEPMPLEAAAYVLRCVAFETADVNTKLGMRTFNVKFNAGDHPVGEQKVKVTVNVLPPVITAPPYTHNLTYVEGSKLMLNPKVQSLRVQASGTMSGAVIWAEIDHGFDESEDQLQFIPGKDFVVKDGIVQAAAAEKKTGAVIGALDREAKRLQITCDERGRGNGKHLNALFKCFHYVNSSKNPSEHRRGVSIGMRMAGMQTVIPLSLLVQSVDDMTAVNLTKQAVRYIVDSPQVCVFDACTVEDADTEVFEAPHSFLKVELQGTATEYDVVALDSGPGLRVDAAAGTVAAADGRELAKLTSKKRGFHLDLLDCPIADLQTIIRSIVYYTQSNGHLRRVAARSVVLQVRGGPSVPPTRVQVSMELALPCLAIPRTKGVAEKPLLVTAGAVQVSSGTGLRVVPPSGGWMQTMPFDRLAVSSSDPLFVLGLASTIETLVHPLQGGGDKGALAELYERSPSGARVGDAFATVFRDFEPRKSIAPEPQPAKDGSAADQGEGEGEGEGAGPPGSDGSSSSSDSDGDGQGASVELFAVTQALRVVFAKPQPPAVEAAAQALKSPTDRELRPGGKKAGGKAAASADEAATASVFHARLSDVLQTVHARVLDPFNATSTTVTVSVSSHAEPSLVSQVSFVAVG